MSETREDYLLRLIAQVRAFLTQVAGHQRAGRTDEALVTALQAQEKLFGCPVTEFGVLSVEEQVAHLLRGEITTEGAAKCALYAELLAASAKSYDQLGQEPLASFARQLALRVLLESRDQVRERAPAAELQARAVELAALLGNDGLTEELARNLAAGIARAVG